MPDTLVTSAVVFFFVFVGVAALGALIVGLRRGDSKRAFRRLQDMSAPGAPLHGSPHWAALAFQKFTALVTKDRTGSLAETRKQLLQAGYFHPNSSGVFLGVKALVTTGLTIGCLAAGFWAMPFWLRMTAGARFRMPPELFVVGCGLFGCELGLIGARLWLSEQVRKRQQVLLRAFPDALDMLVLCLEGGTNITAALQRVTDELQAVHPTLGVEFNIVQQEILLGLTPGTALRKFADRCGLSEVRDLSLVLLQTERFGASLAKTLRTHADTVRQERQARAEEVAQKASVKILFPTLLCIFPAIFIVLLGPAAIQLSRLFAR